MGAQQGQILSLNAHFDHARLFDPNGDSLTATEVLSAALAGSTASGTEKK